MPPRPWSETSRPPRAAPWSPRSSPPRSPATASGASHGGWDGPLSALGDGAEWIRDLVARHFENAEPVLATFHAPGHVAELGRAGFGAEDEAMRGRLAG